MQFRTTFPKQMRARGAGVAGEQVVFDYLKLPSCARSCKILQISESNCVPPASPVADRNTYVDCVCQSEYLRSLHVGGKICHTVCSDQDDQAIQQYYNGFCGTPTPTSTASSTLATMGTPSTSTTTNQPTSARPTPTETQQKDSTGDRPWLHKNDQYAAIAAGIVVAIIIIFLAITYYRYRVRKKSDLESRAAQNRAIPLQPIASPSTQRLRPDGRPDWAQTTPSNTGLSAYGPRSPSASVSSPLAPPSPSYRLGDTLRMYADETREGDGAERWRSPSRQRQSTPGRSLIETERLIMERIRTTGRPDIPLSATPKIRRYRA